MINLLCNFGVELAWGIKPLFYIIDNAIIPGGCCVRLVPGGGCVRLVPGGGCVRLVPGWLCGVPTRGRVGVRLVPGVDTPGYTLAPLWG